MWRYRTFTVCPGLILRDSLNNITRTKHGQSSFILSYDHRSPEHTGPETNSHWFLNKASVDSTPAKASAQPIRELKSFDEFGTLSQSEGVHQQPILKCDRTFMDQLLSQDVSSPDFSIVPTAAELSELGGKSDGNDIEHLEELLDQGYDVSAVLNDLRTSEERIEFSAPIACSSTMDPNLAKLENSILRKAGVPLVHRCPPLPSKSASPIRFDPDISRPIKATADELISAVKNQDLSSLRTILMEKSWPEQRSIGRYLDSLFELVIRDCQDTDEAMVFLQDFAASNRRVFLHDINGIRLACRVACDSGSLEAASETLRIFRNMFLVRSPNATNLSTQTSVLQQFYTLLCSLGPTNRVEEVHKTMVDRGFINSSDVFIRVLTNSMVEKHGFVHAFEEWRRLSIKYGTTSGSELLWERLLFMKEDPTKQAKLAGELLSHCIRYEHPFTVIANLIMSLVRMKKLEAARQLFMKVSVPGRFLRKSLQNISSYQVSSEFVEDFANLVSDCMFAEKRRKRNISPKPSESTFLSSDLLLVLDSFYGSGKPKQVRTPNKTEKKKLHHVNDEQLFELTEFIQNLWLRIAETTADVQAVNRLVAYSITNKLEIAPKLMKRIAEMKSRSSTSVSDP